MSQPLQQLYQFGAFRLDLAERLLTRDGETITLTPKVFDALLLLVENNGHLVTREELMQTVWRDTFVDEHTLTQTISAVRKALGENQNGEKYIETVPRRGYRFVAGVSRLPVESAGLIIERHTQSHIVIAEREICLDATEPAVEPMPAASRRWTKQNLSRRASRILLAVLLMAITAALVFLFLSFRSKPTQPAAGVKSIAVLPFKMLGGQEDDYLKLGLADALITRLGSLKPITVRPTAAVQKFTAEDQDPVAAGRELKVDAVLDGRVQRLGERIRVTVQLLSTLDGSPLWTDKFDGQFTDIFAVQDWLANHLATAIVANLSGEEKAQLAKRYTEDPEAYQLYLKGRYFWNKRTTPDFEKASGYFQQAIALDNNFAPAYAGLADCYSFLQQAPKAKEAALKALSLDDTLAEAHASLGNLSLFSEWNLPEAERELKHAINLNPNYATAHHWYAYYCAAVGQLDEALTEIKRAQEIDPLSLIINTDLGQMLYFARQYDSAIEQLHKTLDMDASFINAHFVLADVYLGEGRYKEAIAEYQKINASTGTDFAADRLAYTYSLSGNRAAERKEMQAFTKSGAPKPHMNYCLALIYVVLGEKDEAFKALLRMSEQKDSDIIYLKVDPKLDNLRSDPRFTDLLSLLGLGS